MRKKEEIGDLREICSDCDGKAEPITKNVNCRVMQCITPGCKGCFDGAIEYIEKETYGVFRR